MRHRIGGLENVYMGLGADNIPYELDNTWSDNKELNGIADKMLDDALEKIFKPNDIEGFDFKVVGDKSKFVVMFGFEPAYKHDPYMMCCITSYYKDSYIEKGVATDYYGKGVEIDYRKTVIEDDCDKVFIEFVDEWYPKLLDTLTIKIVK